jgi:hypothetical protein
MLETSQSPFAWPRLPNTLSQKEMEQTCTRALRLDEFWTSFGSGKRRHLSGTSKTISSPRKTTSLASSADGIAVSDVRILPNWPAYSSRMRLVAASKGIWSTLIVWEVRLDDKDNTLGHQSQELTRWTCHGGIFRGLVVNEDPQSEYTLAISVYQKECVCRHSLLLCLI